MPPEREVWSLLQSWLSREPRRANVGETDYVCPSSAPVGWRRRRPLVLVASPDADLIQHLVGRVHRSDMVACVARSQAGCLRVAAAIGPDLVLLDARLPRRLEAMLRSHPATATTTLVRVNACSGSALPEPRSKV